MENADVFFNLGVTEGKSYFEEMKSRGLFRWELERLQEFKWAAMVQKGKKNHSVCHPETRAWVSFPYWGILVTLASEGLPANHAELRANTCRFRPPFQTFQWFSSGAISSKREERSSEKKKVFTDSQISKPRQMAETGLHPSSGRATAHLGCPPRPGKASSPGATQRPPLTAAGTFLLLAER